MERIPQTYYDGNLEDRNAGADFWAWLEQQPLQAWLFYARGANWDNADTIFESMVEHPRCDLAIASWLFWQSEPRYWLERNERPNSKSLLGLILHRCENGGFPSGAVHYDRTEVALAAFGTAQALRKLDGPPAFDVPRHLIQSFEGSNPAIGPYQPDLEQDLAEIFNDDPGKHSAIWGSFYRSDGGYLDRQRRGNWWFEPALRLPKSPVPNPGMSTVEAIDAVFGEHRSSLQRIEQERLRINRQPRRRQSTRHDVNRWGMTNDPTQRAVGLGLFGISMALLALFLWNWVSR